MTLGNDNGTDGQTDRRTDRVRRNTRPPPREEGRIIIIHQSMQHKENKMHNLKNIIKQKAHLMLTNPRVAFRGQSRSPNIVPFHVLGIVSY